jgi:FAD synthase
VEVDGRPVSSSRVRAEILAGRLDEVFGLLCRSYRLAGTVVAGQRRGHSLGFPTANLDGIRTLIPGNGVYAVRATHAGKSWPAAANVGPNPTFGEHARKPYSVRGELLSDEKYAEHLIEMLPQPEDLQLVSEIQSVEKQWISPKGSIQ